MKKRFSLLWSLLAMVVVCACSKSGGSDYPGSGKGRFNVSSYFLTNRNGRKGSAIHGNSRNFMVKYQTVQFLLYNASGQVVYSTIVNPTSALTTFTYTDVPVGTGYTLVAVANVKSSSILPLI